MKIDPISTSERAYIIGFLATHGKWGGERKGHQVSIVRYQASGRQHVQWSVRLKSATVNGAAPTVRRACDAINETIAGRQHVRPEVIPYQAARRAGAGEWLPYVDAQL